MTTQPREYLDALDGVLDDLDTRHGSRAGAGADALAETVDHAATAGEIWAQAKVCEWMRDAARRDLNRRARERDRVTVSYQGAVVALGHRRGTRTRNADSGEVVHQQRLMEDLTWAELDGRERDAVRQIRALAADAAAMRQLRRLHAAHPETSTVGEALAAERVSLDDVLMGRWTA